jgi:hypothetical protein
MIAPIGPLVVMTALLAAPATAATSTTVHDAPAAAACIRAVASQRPWLEKTLWGLYDQERGWVGAEIANRNGTFDLGLLQVNSSWVSTISVLLHRDAQDVRRWIRDDACFNVGIAAWLFLSGYSRDRNYWEAVGSYHSPTAWRARAYAQEVAAKLRFRFGPRIFSPR